MQDDPDRDHRRTSATRAHECTTHFELPTVRRRNSLLHGPIHCMPPEIGRKSRPLLLGIPQPHEELRLEATDRMGWRQEVVAHLRRIDDRSLCTRELHALNLHRVLATTKHEEDGRPRVVRPTSLPLSRERRCGDRRLLRLVIRHPHRNRRWSGRLACRTRHRTCTCRASLCDTERTPELLLHSSAQAAD